jgi:cbb3-type cytochrome oxidase subunit 3
MIFGHEWLMLFAAILVLGVVVWFLWRRPRSFDHIGAQLPAPDDPAHDPAGEPGPAGSRRRTP